MNPRSYSTMLPLAFAALCGHSLAFGATGNRCYSLDQTRPPETKVPERDDSFYLKRAQERRDRRAAKKEDNLKRSQKVLT